MPLNEGSEDPTSKDFIVINGIDITIEDFVSIWNGENILPELSPNEIEIAEKNRGHTRAYGYSMGDEEDILKFFRRGYDPTVENKLRVQKGKSIRSLIENYQKSGQPRAILQMDRVLAALSDGNMRYDDVSAFVARFAEPNLEEIDIVISTAADTHALVKAGSTSSRYLTKENAKPLSTLSAEDQELASETLAIMNRSHSLIPIFILEKALVGHEPTRDDFAELTLYRNIGSTRLVNIIQESRIALFGLGILTMIAGLYLSHDAETIRFLMEAGMSISTVGAASHWIPTAGWKVKRKRATSIDRYKAIYKTLRNKIEEMNQTPAGRVRIMLLIETIRGTHEPDAQTNIASLKTFVDLLKDPQIEADFNAMYSSADRPWHEAKGVLEAVKDFGSGRAELGIQNTKGLLI